MSSTTQKEFSLVELARCQSAGYKFIEIQATGKEIESSEDCYRKEVILIPHKTKPASDHYVVDIEDGEILEIAKNGTDTDIFFIQTI